MGRADAQRSRQREARREQGRGGRIRRLFTWRKLLGALFVFCLLAMGGFYAVYLLVPVPSANAEAELQSNVYRYSDGSILARTGKINRSIVGLDKIPDPVEKAFVAAENKTFYEDSGVDFKGTARGVVNTITGKGKQGGSTITQQYVKNYYLDQSQTVTRKLKELVISLKVDQRKSKEEILAGYLNTSYYGRGAYGIQAAAQAYYGVDAGKLTVEQGAYLAALLQAPSQYDWTSASPSGRKLVTQRWNYVLDNMVEERWLDPAERAGMDFPEPQSPRPAPGMEGQTGYLVAAANQELIRQGVAEEDITAGGWTITLHVDKKRQKELVEAVDKQLESRLDREDDEVDAAVQAGATSVDPKTGHVVALYGGVGATEHWTSNATRRDYQPASTFKPLVFAAALENRSRTQDGRRIGVNTVYDGTSRRPVRGGATYFAPQNEDDRSYGPVTVQRAMNKSINSVFAQMIVDVGPAEVKKTALALGMRDVDGFVESPAMSLGTMNASTWDMAGVYATLDNHGKRVTPSIVKSAEHRDRTAQLADPIGPQVVSRRTADTVTSVLTGVVRNGSGQAAGTPAYQAAGKTGTSENNKSAWFAGYTPELTTVVALFGEDAQKGTQTTLTGTAGMGRANGGGFPARIWADYTLDALGGGSDARFDLDVTEIGDGGPQPSASPSESTTPSAPPSDEPDEPTTGPSSSAPVRTPSTPAPPSSPTPPTQSPSSSPSSSPDPGGSGDPGTDPGTDVGLTDDKASRP
ncbi:MULTISPECIES: transglycosylase domain-containing protein [Streptomyces]|uniref:Penicillin-binding protein 1A n=2 Tax=Streptomyces TaxID=1883 RepID=A0A1D8G5W5_9ACTN|nr:MULTISPECIES: transglycosylase domain-containing protein [Streptomyces]AOT60817.1 Penicillin-binding protein 1A [Streptomyces rubrolavendulae]KAF0649426.1 penicillin-binding protein [Streptomyces fradiae ATCC 10745 = DSM 40063]OSY51693.1 Penicillin-binding protein 1A [Streptomyces fradiae ATCC 10745 = DSM 40063]QEV13887.1 penicillin-binding protein [Streptomyces fradiae ATCC 10745 = DSM 40063]UQS30869.1 penicillin-binding protein [Streptomyces fradiae]